MTKPDFSKNQDGLVAAIAQDWKTGEVLMLAWMNEAAWDKTLEMGKAVYWSRSRKQLWMKGETSGNIQDIKDMYLDCDQDAVLLKVEQRGSAACHKGYRSCFYRHLINGKLETVGEKIFNPDCEI